jgi:sugar lactone lactonase YvrE
MKLNSPNDIITRSDESIYFTNPNGGLYNVAMEDYDVQKYIPTQQVLRLAPGATEPELLADDFENPNGICFSPDEAILYVNDTRRKHIRAWDVRPDGSVCNGRLFAETRGAEVGGPDGMRADVEGNVYCTGPAGIHVFDPAGRLLGRLHCPKAVANMTWGGDDWRTLYLTARETLYRMRLSIPGVPHGSQYRREALAAAGKL